MTPPDSFPPLSTEVLPDVIDHDLSVVFCGTAAGNESARRRAYYAGPGNAFWPTLFKVGLTPRQFSYPRSSGRCWNMASG